MFRNTLNTLVEVSRGVPIEWECGGVTSPHSSVLIAKFATVSKFKERREKKKKGKKKEKKRKKRGRKEREKMIEKESMKEGRK